MTSRLDVINTFRYQKIIKHNKYIFIHRNVLQYISVYENIYWIYGDFRSERGGEDLHILGVWILWQIFYHPHPKILPSTPKYFYRYFTIHPQILWQIIYRLPPNILHWVRVCAFQTRSSQILRCTDSPKPGLQYIFCNFNKEAQNHQTNRNKLKQTYASDRKWIFCSK